MAQCPHFIPWSCWIFFLFNRCILTLSDLVLNFWHIGCQSFFLSFQINMKKQRWLYLNIGCPCGCFEEIWKVVMTGISYKYSFFEQMKHSVTVCHNFLLLKYFPTCIVLFVWLYQLSMNNRILEKKVSRYTARHVGIYTYMPVHKTQIQL